MGGSGNAPRGADRAINIQAGTSSHRSEAWPERLCSGKPPGQPSRSPHEREHSAPPRDAMDKEARVPRSRGRSLVVLYNTARPHSSLGYQTPSAFAGTLASTGSDAALNEGFASPPVAQTAPYGVTETAEALIATG
ncbi:MAG: hypothetical protein EOR79_36370 [Mesorhizobium sp.]|nr:MAG: hypothetical protein EOR79_36370 [Mesorhizobium sp.]